MINNDLAITDTAYRISPSAEMQRAIKEHEAENMRRAEEKEKMLLERRGMIDVLIDFANATQRIWARKFAKKRIAQR